MLLQAEQEVCMPSSRDANAPFDTMLAAEQAQLVRFCAYLTGKPDVAQDLAQETLFEAWRNRHKLHNHETFSLWLRAIARNVCLRWGRSHSRDLAHLAPNSPYADEAEPSIEELAVDDYDLEIALERDELVQLLDRALALLPPVTRDVLVERYIRESPYAEIAERLGLSEDALAQRLHRGKIALRRIITTRMSKEAAAYGFSSSEADKPEEETRIWCPMCGQTKLTRYCEPPTGRLGFTCSQCGHIASAPNPQLWSGVSSPKSILGRQLVWLEDYYWQAIDKGVGVCVVCGQVTHARICQPQDIPEQFYQRGRQAFHGVYIVCASCHHEEINPLSHLTLDTAVGQQFWRKHPRMRWLPERQIEYANQPALLASFQSVTDAVRLNMIFQRETLQLLDFNEDNG